MNAKYLFACLFFIGLSAFSQKQTTMTKKAKLPSLYDQNIKVETLTGEQFDLSSLKGKKVIIVNTASKCGLTPQYEQLETLYKKYKDQGLVIIGFPANNFAEQEPGSNKDIAQFCQANYGVTFPMMSKISVKGKDIAPLYQFLTQKSKNGVKDAEVEWNFQKFLINEKGEFIRDISPKTSPLDDSIVSWVNQKRG